MKNSLSLASDEKDVERIYRNSFENNFGVQSISTKFKTDGYLVADDISILFEFKYDVELTLSTVKNRILSQCIYYLKKFELAGKEIPKFIFIGDKNECFILHTNEVIKFLFWNLDWDVAPSSRHPELEEGLSKEKIQPFIFNIDDDFKFQDVIDKIVGLNSNIDFLIKINEHNIDRIYNQFLNNVVPSLKISVNDKVNLFTQLLINSESNFLHPNKNVIVTENFGDIKVRRKDFQSFFSHFDGINYSPKEKEFLISILDRLIEDTTRRKQGEYFTPTNFVDLAHDYISDTFGKDWRNEYVVWDCACGTKNLTRDYKFKELYCSTLNQSDLDSAERFNPEATSFQYDFLNDDMDMELVSEIGWKMPQGLRDAIDSRKKILFLINPPYATSTNIYDGKKGNKSGTSDTLVNKLMKEEKWGGAGQLFTQFLYRINQIPNANIALFSKSNFLNSLSFNNFRSKFNYQYQKGFFFSAGHFQGTSSVWGISFTLFKPGILQNEFDIDLVDNLGNGPIVIGSKTLYNLDHTAPASKWIREELKGLTKTDGPNMSTPINVKVNDKSNLVIGSIGSFLCNSNSVSKNTKQTGLFSAAYSSPDCISIIPENFEKVLSLYGGRRLVSGSYANWINDKDEYMVPNTDHTQYQQYVNDSLIIALFDHQSQQGSLRQVEYKDELWDIKNEFFWLGRDTMINLANDHHYDALYNDGKMSEERHVYKLLSEGWELSEDALDVLNRATRLLVSSMEHREEVSSQFPEWHLDSWDCGYGQLKRLWKITNPDEFQAFRDSYKKLCDRMRPLVYELGFLK